MLPIAILPAIASIRASRRRVTMDQKCRCKALRFGHLNGILMSANVSSKVVRFSTFEINLQTGELRHNGQKVKLQRQPFQVLATLLERPGEMVTREELRSRLWPKDTFVDFDHSLNAAIKRLRDALGESADSPVFVETLARRGYRFIGPLNGTHAGGSGSVPAPPPIQSPFLTRWIVITCLALALIALLAWTMRRIPTGPKCGCKAISTIGMSSANIFGLRGGTAK